jgi:hypothetical protein
MGEPLTREEQTLLRLFRCLTPTEQEEVLFQILKTLGARCSFNPTYSLSAPETLAEELANDDLDSRLMAARPCIWPGQQIVDLNSVGDPGFWLDAQMGNSQLFELFGIPFQQTNTAEGLAESYLFKIREEGLPLPSDFGNEDVEGDWSDEDEAMVEADFTAFLNHWRERVVSALEKQNPPAQAVRNPPGLNSKPAE